MVFFIVIELLRFPHKRNLNKRHELINSTDYNCFNSFHLWQLLYTRNIID